MFRQYTATIADLGKDLLVRRSVQNQETTLTWDPLLFASIYLSTDDVIFFFLSHPFLLDFSLYSPVNCLQLHNCYNLS
jgi:hypothetical protein